MATECYQSVGPASVGASKADEGWFLCVLHPLSLHPSALHQLRSANPGGGVISGGVRKESRDIEVSKY